MMRKSWTEEEIQFVIDNYQSMTDDDIGKVLNCSKSTVERIRRNNGLIKRTHVLHNFEEVKQICSEREYTLLTEEHEYIDVKSPIKYICSKHSDKGIQTGCLGNFLTGRGCWYCGRERVGMSHRKDISEDELKKMCEEKDFTYIDKYREKGELRIKFICNKHKLFGVQSVRIHNLKHNKGCQYCSGKNTPLWYVKNEISRNNPNVELLEDENRKKSYVQYTCKIHKDRIYYDKIEVLMGGGGLPCCKGAKSNGERKLSGLIHKFGFDYEHQYTFNDCCDLRPLPFDIAIMEDNKPICVIEYDGEQHYRPMRFHTVNTPAAELFEKIQKHDDIKNQYCQEHNIPLIRIPYYEFDNMESFLFEELKKLNIVD